MERLMATGRPILLVIDVQGAKTFKTIHPEACVIFLTASRQDLLGRLQARGSAAEEVERRMKHIDEELTYEAIADTLIENQDGDLLKTIEGVKEFIRARAS
jgi:guanylate kinase